MAGVPYLATGPGDWVSEMAPKDYRGPRDWVDVIMNPHRAPELAPIWARHPDQVVLYETENLISAAGWRMASERVRRACPRNKWWNYSAANSAVFGDTPKPLRIPPGERAHTTGASPPKIVDVAFVGSMNQRRMDLLAGLRRAGATVAVHTAARGLFGADLAAFEAQARVVLNVHYYAPGIFESFRVVPAVARGARVVSELSIDNEGAEFCARVAGYHNLKNAVLEELERK
jgi:hypothetical protein